MCYSPVMQRHNIYFPDERLLRSIGRGETFLLRSVKSLVGEGIAIERDGKLLAFGLYGDLFSKEQLLQDLQNRKVWRKACWQEVKDSKNLEDYKDLELWGSAFQQKVWAALHDISETVSYAALAQKAGFSSKYARAIGTAMRMNPIAILIPCHLVVPTQGWDCGNYYWGQWFKKKLLRI